MDGGAASRVDAKEGNSKANGCEDATQITGGKRELEAEHNGEIQQTENKSETEIARGDGNGTAQEKGIPRMNAEEPNTNARVKATPMELDERPKTMKIQKPDAAKETKGVKRGRDGDVNHQLLSSLHLPP